MATTRDDIQKLVDALPESRLSDARSVLEPLLWPDVPDDDEPVTDVELAALAEAHDERARGATVPHETFMRELGL